VGALVGGQRDQVLLHGGILPGSRHQSRPELTPQEKSGDPLGLAGPGVSDTGLKELKELKTLQGLDLAATKITDAGLKELKELKGLQTLGLYRTEREFAN